MVFINVISSAFQGISEAVQWRFRVFQGRFNRIMELSGAFRGILRRNISRKFRDILEFQGYYKCITRISKGTSMILWRFQGRSKEFPGHFERFREEDNKNPLKSSEKSQNSP